MTLAHALATTRLAIVAIGTVTVALDVACVVQALPLPPALAPLPRRRGALAGVVERGGVLVPVVDLARWIDTGTATKDAAARRILVLRQGGRTIGLLVDALQGFADVPASAIARLHHDADPEEVFQASVRLPAADTVAALLEVARLMALVGAWHDEDASVTAAGPAAPTLATDQQEAPVLCAVLRAGQALLALPAIRLAAVFARPALERVGLGGSAFCRWNGRHVPVVEVTAAAGERGLLAVIEHEGRLLGILVDAALDMRPLRAPSPDAALATMYDDAGQAIDFIDVPALFARHPETELSVRHAACQAGASRAVNEAAQLVFDAGGTLATPIAAVEQVLPFDAADDVAPATMPWQGRAIALRDLRQVRGGGAVLVLRHGSEHVACVVERVRSMVPPGGGQVYTMAQPGQAGAARFITVAGEGGAVSYRIVDLVARLEGLGSVPA